MVLSLDIAQRLARLREAEQTYRREKARILEQLMTEHPVIAAALCYGDDWREIDLEVTEEDIPFLIEAGFVPDDLRTKIEMGQELLQTDKQQILHLLRLGLANYRNDVTVMMSNANVIPEDVRQKYIEDMYSNPL